MKKVIERLKEELDSMSSENLMITVKRSDLENLLKAYEALEQKQNNR